MATAATAACSPGEQQDFVDQRNLEWKSDNVGSKLLAKMGWREGQAVGKRQREQGATVTSQGLRAMKRREGLGLGAAASAALSKNQRDPQHVGDFGLVLAALREEHGTTSSSSKEQQAGSKKKSKRRSSFTTAAVLPTNKSTHAAVRQAKFQEKSADDLKCIFAGAVLDYPKIRVGSEEDEKPSGGSDKKRKSRSDKDKKKKKKSKKERKET